MISAPPIRVTAIATVKAVIPPVRMTMMRRTAKEVQAAALI